MKDKHPSSGHPRMGNWNPYPRQHLLAAQPPFPRPGFTPEANKTGERAAKNLILTAQHSPGPLCDTEVVLFGNLHFTPAPGGRGRGR